MDVRCHRFLQCFAQCDEPGGPISSTGEFGYNCHHSNAIVPNRRCREYIFLFELRFPLTVLQIIFGITSDRYGRKWPLVANLALCSVIQLGSGFVKTFPQFLAARSLFGVAMGGVWGLAASTGLENLPVELRGLAGGILQQGYSVGYLIAAVINLYLVPETKTTWRSLFWCASGISMFTACFRAILPESAVFLRAKEMDKARGTTTSVKTKIFIHETKTMLRRHWLLFIYAVLLMTGKLLVMLA
jgi:MFS transporter, SHS family, lactate transporter